LIRAAAKNYIHVVVVPFAGAYPLLLDIMEKNNGYTTLSNRRQFAAMAFNISSHYDIKIFEYLNSGENIQAFKQSIPVSFPMRYGENPHQKGTFYGNLEEVFTQLHGKELSYNNLVDADSAINLIGEFTEPTAAIIKHTNPCGIATRPTLKEAYLDALACDPVSAFGGIIIVNSIIDMEIAEEINKLFFEILIAEGYENDALERLKSKKNRIILHKNSFAFAQRQFKSVLNGVLEQEKDLRSEMKADFQCVTDRKPSHEESDALVFANKVVKHLKSNAIVLVKHFQLIGCGMGQTSRVDALRHHQGTCLRFQPGWGSDGFGCVFSLCRLRGDRA
jgi:phosphoribosylaminoimidazolecarboxamide formyltransferase/IMP cyclohydrolase